LPSETVVIIIIMAINRSKVTVGFVVAGILAVFLGTVLVFVGPIIIDDQIVKVSMSFVNKLLRCVLTFFLL